MERVAVKDAVGMVLSHDITRIVPDLFKGRAFKKGHVITEADINELLKLGKEHIYAQTMDGEVHENDAGVRIAVAAAGRGLTLTEPYEGKISVVAEIDGMLKVNIDGLYRINDINDVMFADLHQGSRRRHRHLRSTGPSRSYVSAGLYRRCSRHRAPGLCHVP